MYLCVTTFHCFVYLLAKTRRPFLLHLDSHLLLQTNPLPSRGCSPTPLRLQHRAPRLSLLEVSFFPWASSNLGLGSCGALSLTLSVHAYLMPLTCKYSERRWWKKRDCLIFVCAVCHSPDSFDSLFCVFLFPFISVICCTSCTYCITNVHESRTLPKLGLLVFVLDFMIYFKLFYYSVTSGYFI